MGIVYRARDLTLGREVALKCPLPKLAADRNAARRFLREARAASALSHANVVAVFEVFEERSLPWIVMELAEGQSLRKRLETGGPLPVDEVLQHAEGLVGALRAAHARHILHRDITPKNVILAPDGRARLTDFGLAKVFVSAGDVSSADTQSTAETEVGAVVGTPAYMSPEQALGRRMDQRSDIFALGILLYEMCTGTVPFDGRQRGEILDAILHREPPAIGRFNGDVPPELERIIRKCLAKRPEERYQDAEDLLADLLALRRQTGSGTAASDTSVRLPSRWLRPRNVVAAMALGALVVVSVTAIIRYLVGGKDFPKGSPSRVTAGLGWEGHPALSPDGSQIAYASDESGNTDIWLVDVQGGVPLRLTDDPAVDDAPTWFPDGRSIAFTSNRSGRWAIWKVARLGGTPVLLVPDAGQPAISPDGKRIAFARQVSSGDTRIMTAPTADVTQLQVLTGDSDGFWGHRQPAWSPDGRMIAYADFRDLWIAPVSGGEPWRLTTEGQTDAEPVWSSDGQHVFFSSFREGTQAIWRVPVTGGAAKRLTLGTGPESRPSVSRDGSRLAFTTLSRHEELTIQDLETGESSTLPGLDDTTAPTIAPDLSAIVFVVSRAGRSDLWHQSLEGLDPSGPPRRLTEQQGVATSPAYSPDGRWIAYYLVEGGERDIWIVPSSGGPPTRFTNHPAMDVVPAWSPDGNKLAFASDRDGQDHIWIASVSEGRTLAGEPVRLTSGESREMSPAWSPDGRVVAYIGSAAGSAEVWMAPLDGASPPRRITERADAHRIRWDRRSGLLYASGTWGRGQITLRSISPEGGPAVPHDPEVRFGSETAWGGFDISPDGRLLVYSSEKISGDVWVYESESGSY